MTGIPNPSVPSDAAEPNIPTPTPESVQDPVREPDPEHAHEGTTTHAGYGEGSPRLLLGHGGWAYEDEGQTTFWLDRERTVIGSGPDADIHLDGLAPAHAEIRHDERDDYVLTLLADGGAPTVAGGHGVDHPGTQALHSGARIEVGGWTLTFERDEFADHGRPFGGREGGEGDVQTGQPARPDYTAEHDAARDQGNVDQVQGDLAQDEQAVGE